MTPSLEDIRKRPGGEFVTDCTAAVERRARIILAREDRYREQGQATDADALHEAALLLAACAMLDQIKSDGGWMTQPGSKPNHTVVKAVTAGKTAYHIARGIET